MMLTNSIDFKKAVLELESKGDGMAQELQKINEVYSHFPLIDSGLTSIFKYDIPFSNKSSYILLLGKSDSTLLSSKLA